MSKVLNVERTLMDGLSENLAIDDLVYYKYAPINYVDVER